MPLCSYSRTRVSGLVESENIGCSIEAISALGTASKISQTKKSPCGYLSGSRGERLIKLSSDKAESFRTFTHVRVEILKSHADSYFHPQRVAFVLLPTFFRTFTHVLSYFHTRQVEFKRYLSVACRSVFSLNSYLTQSNTEELWINQSSSHLPTCIKSTGPWVRMARPCRLSSAS